MNLSFHSLQELRPHHRSLGLLAAPSTSLDHDFHVAGVVPSVCVLVDIPGHMKVVSVPQIRFKTRQKFHLNTIIYLTRLAERMCTSKAMQCGVLCK